MRSRNASSVRRTAAAHVAPRHESRADRGAPVRATTAEPAPSVAVDRAPDASRSLPFDVSEVIHRVHLAYRVGADGGAVGAGDTYAVSVSGEGATTVSTLPGSSPGEPREYVAQLRLEPARFERGGRTLTASADTPEVAEDGHLTIDRGSYVEHLRNDDQEMEQSWTFATKPEGSGDLRVAIAVGGSRYVSTTATGVHFSREGGGSIGLRYGHATVVDAAGARTEIPVVYQSNALVMNVPSRVLDDAAYPVVIDPTITAEVAVDAPVPGIVHPAAKNSPAVAWSGTQYLVVWVDARNTFGQLPGIYGTRLSPAGVVLDIGGIPIATTTGAMSVPEVASNDPDFLVVFEQAVAATGEDVKAVRVTAAGAVLDAAPITVCSAVDDQTTPHVASDGTGYAIVWRDYRSGTRDDVYAARVTAAGVVQDANGKSVDFSATTNSIASNGTNYVIAYTAVGATRDVQSRTFAPSTGALGSTQDISVNASADEYRPVIASNGSAYMVAWTDERTFATNNEDVYGARLDAAGAPVALSEFQIAHSTAHEDAESMARFGVDYFFTSVRDPVTAGTTTREVRRILATGSVASTDSLGTYGSGRFLAASDGSSVVTVNSDNATASARILSYGSGSWNGTSIAPWVIANTEKDPAIGFNGSTYLVAWSDASSTGASVNAVRVATSGAVLDSSAAALGSGSLPAVSSNGTEFAVVWVQGSGTVRVRRVGADGVPIGAAAASTGLTDPTVGAPGIAWNGSTYLIVGQAQARRYSSAGVLDPTTLTVGGVDASVASNGTDFLIAFRTGAAGAYDVSAQRVSGAGVVLDASPLVVSGAANAQQHPSVASDGTGYLVVWDDGRSATTDIYGARVTSAGAVTDSSGLAIATETGAQINPSVAWDGTEYVAIWDDHRGATSDIYGTRVFNTGVVESATVGTLLSAATTIDETLPCISRGPALTFLLAYVVPPTALPYLGAQRVRSRSLTYGSGTGAVCNTGADCDSTMCVDGVCCTTACAGGTTDCMACSVAAGAGGDGTCSVVLFGASICRPSTGLCDRAEVCGGLATCPPDAMEPVTTTCRAAADVCDVAETCTGSGPACPGDGFVAAATTCRPAVPGGCDVVEACTGSSPYCPTDGYQPTNTVCHASVGGCDVPEVCSGTDPSCPGDTVLNSGTPCRPVADLCDVAEFCNGTSGVCPMDGFKGNLSQCDTAHGPCDFPDFCTGNRADCPEDWVPDGTGCDDTKACTTGDQCSMGLCVGTTANAGSVCRAAAPGGCDVAETCDGVLDTCPADGFAPTTTECRVSAGPCDPAENCTGIAAICPGDVRSPSGTVCHPAAAGGCDVAESCDGSSPLCPTDAFASAGTTCRPAASTGCDVAETCPGGSATCPIDGYVTDGTSCDDGLACTQTSACQVGACAPMLTLDCSDGNACTTDTCAEPSGCAHTVIAACMGDAGTDAGNNTSTDAGAGSDSGTVTPPPAQGGCSCRVAPVDDSSRTAALFTAIVLGVVAGRRRSRRTR